MNDLNEKQSLALINQMIESARNNISKKSGTPMITNGIAAGVISLLNIALAFLLAHMQLNPVYSFWIWGLMLPVHLIVRKVSNKTNQEALVKTHLDRVIANVWEASGIGIWTSIGLVFIFGYFFDLDRLYYLIVPLVLLFCGVALYITGHACRFKPLILGSFVMWLGVMACAVCTPIIPHIFVQLVICSICMLLGFVIPGYKLNLSAHV